MIDANWYAMVLAYSLASTLPDTYPILTRISVYLSNSKLSMRGDALRK